MNKDLIKYVGEVISVGGDNDNQPFNTIYKDIAEVFGIDVALHMYHMYGGTQISFPTRFFDREYVKKQVPVEYDGTNIKQLAKKYDYSEKTIRRMIKDSK